MKYTYEVRVLAESGKIERFIEEGIRVCGKASANPYRVDQGIITINTISENTIYNLRDMTLVNVMLTSGQKIEDNLQITLSSNYPVSLTRLNALCDKYELKFQIASSDGQMIVVKGLVAR